MPFAEVNDQRIHYEDTGGDGPPIVFSHAFFGDHEMFAPQVEDLSDVYRVLTWDQRGFGTTPADGAPFTPWDSAGDLFAVLDRIGIERAVLAGVAEGASLSLRAALLHPDRARAVVLIDGRIGTEGAEALDHDDVSGRLHELAMPVLVVHGAGAVASPLERAREVCAAVADCRGVIEVPDAAPASNLARPDVVNPAIRSFLEGLPA